MRSNPVAQTTWKLVQSPLVIVLVALAVRFWAASQLLPQKAAAFFYQNNEPARIAWALVTGHGYSSPWPNTPLLATAQQPPGYPLLVAGIFEIFGAYSMSALWVAISINAVFAALTGVLILEIGRRNFGIWVGVVSAWVWACWLYEAAVSIRLWEDALSALLLSMALLWLPKVAESARLPRWVLFGLLAGAAALINTSLLILFPFFWAWLWFTSGAQASVRMRLVVSSVAVCILLVLPWTIRNYAAFHRLIPVRDNLGLEFWLGNHEGAPNGLQRDFPLVDPSEYNRLGEINFMQAKREMGYEFARQHPAY
ncbi:MAG: glycosyltransferase family 39 protein, partial [Acidobacteriaceae bacterium]|nr:glycosyltransferase family 39 protein [Acidobacteriaceae bacterium]